MDQKKLKKLYDKYVKDKYFYRTFSEEYLAQIKRKGFNPSKNPYEQQNNNIIYFCKLLDKLEKKGYYYVYFYWPSSKPLGSIISRIFRKSLRKKYVDLTPNDFNDLKYYQKRQGGDIPITIHHISKDLIRWNYPLSTKDLTVIKKLQTWAKKRMSFKNVTIKISATSSCLEKAHLQRFWGQAYLPSPFGSFENFSKKIIKYGWKAYRPCLLGKESYYIRFQHRIFSKDIEF